MKTKKTIVGDIILIPLEQGFRPAKVLYVSLRYKDTILLGLYKNLVADLHSSCDLEDTFELLIYTSRAPIRKNRWHYIGHEALRTTQQSLDFRVVAGERWQGDTHLGPASEEDKTRLPEMLVMGVRLVEEKAALIS